MSFSYDKAKDRVVDAETEAEVYQTSRFLDADPPGLCYYRYSKGDFVVDFMVFPASGKGVVYRWKGEERQGSFSATMYVLEPNLRESFFDAFEERSGKHPSNEDYLRFKNIVQEALLVYAAGRSRAIEGKPHFEIVSVPEAKVIFTSGWLPGDDR